MNASAEPPWQFLPHQPRLFFGLPDDANKEALKLAYSQLIRRYKPDQFPAEFKKIRAAYDALEREMRFGMFYLPSETVAATPDSANESSHVSSPPDEAHADTHAATEGIESRSAMGESQLTDRAAAYQRAGQSDPQAWYNELRNKSTKSSYDYYLLAILSDVVSDSEKGFSHWIAEGADVHPRDVHLSSVLNALLNEGALRTDETHSLLLALAQSRRPLEFYYMTDALWQRYVLDVPWEEFSATLGRCDRELRLKSHAGRTAFLVALMRRALWRAPVEWLREQKRLIDESPGELNGDLEFDHELNCKLLNLRESHCERLESGSYGRRILSAIRTFCEVGEWEAATEVCGCQVDIAQHPTEFLAEFSFKPEENTDWSQSWSWISWMVLSKLPTQEAPGDRIWMVQTIYEMMRRIDAGFPRRVENMTSALNLLGLIFFLICSFFTIAFAVLIASIASMTLLGMQSQAYLVITLLAMLVGLVISVLSYYRIAKVWKARLIVPFIRKRVIAQHETKWRLLIARTMQMLLCPFPFLYQIVQELSSDKKNMGGPSQWLTTLLPNDLGLILYSAAVPFLR
ncbi:MAG: hypothetical protein WCI02_16435 [Planctomycetota bacterium]